MLSCIWNGYLNITLQIFEMVDAKARQDCIKEIDLLKVSSVPGSLVSIQSCLSP